MYARNRHPSFNARMAAQVVAFFACKEEKRTISKLKVIKLIYISDRESIKTQGEPILSDDRFSLDHGPINSATLSLIDGSGSATQLTTFKQFVTRIDSRTSVSKRDFSRDDFDELSDMDIEVLESVWEEHGNKSASALRAWTHRKSNVPEYSEPPAGSRTEISLSDIYKAVGVDSEALADLESMEYAERLLSTGS